MALSRTQVQSPRKIGRKILLIFFHLLLTLNYVSGISLLAAIHSGSQSMETAEIASGVPGVEPRSPGYTSREQKMLSFIFIQVCADFSSKCSCFFPQIFGAAFSRAFW